MANLRLGKSLLSSLTVSAVLAGCSAGSGDGPGNAGAQSNSPPRALATVIGHTTDGAGVVRVRSGAEVLLSGKDSDGIDSAILAVRWRPINTAAQAVTLVERNANTVSFRAPVPASTVTSVELQFQVAVETADGDTSTRDVRVIVEKILDPNEFLLTDINATKQGSSVAIVAAATATLPTMSSDVPFQIRVQKRVQYRLSGSTGSSPSSNPAPNDPVFCLASPPATHCVKIGAATILNSSWRRAEGVVGTNSPDPGNAWQNPRFRLLLPTLNADEVNAAILTRNATATSTPALPAGDASRANLLNLIDIDSADAEYEVTLIPDPGVAASLGSPPVVLALASNGGTLTEVARGTAPASNAPASLVVRQQAVLAQTSLGGAVVESRQTAINYYQAIDPDGRKLTLDAWLADNCMDPVAAPYGSDLDATYTNNFDLGFGREMYFKTNCADAEKGRLRASIDTRSGERASIVFNYPSLEAAIKRSGAFLAVAMEYRADPSGGPRYTRFYTFAPDPAALTPAGTTGSPPPFTRSWKRVLSANFDGRGERFTPGNCTVCHGGKPRVAYTRGGGAPLGSVFLPWDVKSLLFADTDPSLLDARLRPGYTEVPQERRIKRLNLEGMLPTLEDRPNDSPEVTARRAALRDMVNGWYGSDANAVFRKEHVPASWTGQTSPRSPGVASATLYQSVFAQNCRSCHMQRITDEELDPAGLLRVARVPQFASFADVDGVPASPDELDTIRRVVFDQHYMPGSRLTADRFWLPPATGGMSPAAVLAQYLNLASPGDRPRVQAQALVTQEIPGIEGPGAPGTAYRFSAVNSVLASGFRWTLQRPDGSQAVLVGSETSEPALRTDVSGRYVVSLTAVAEDSSGSTIPLAPISVNRTPLAGSNTLESTIFPCGTTPCSRTQDLAALITRPGDGTPVLALGPVVTGLTRDLLGTCSSTSCVVRLTPNAVGTFVQSYTITDTDGDTSTGTISIQANALLNWPVPSFAPEGIQRSCLAAGGTNPCRSNSIPLPPNYLQGYGGPLGSLTASVELVCPTSSVCDPTRTLRAGRRGTNGEVSVSGAGFSYRAPPFFVSNQGGNQPVLDSFRYRVVLRDSNGVQSTSAEGTVSVNVASDSAFGGSNGVYFSVLASSSCSACHLPPAPPLLPLARRSADTGSSWQAEGPLTTYGYLTNGGSTVLTTDGSVRRNGQALDCPIPLNQSTGPGATTDTGRCVDFAIPDASLLLTKPLGTTTHAGVRLNPLTETQRLTILNWILEGAYPN